MISIISIETDGVHGENEVRRQMHHFEAHFVDAALS